jgi:hypothetical protein
MNMTPVIPRDLDEKVRRELEAGERIRWVDQPVPRFFTPTSTAAFLFDDTTNNLRTRARGTGGEKEMR